MTKKQQNRIIATPDSRLDKYIAMGLPLSRVVSVKAKPKDANQSKPTSSFGVVFSRDLKIDEKAFVSENGTINIEGKGTEGLGYVPWGASNNLPNRIVANLHQSPYTAPGVKFNSEVIYANGPKALYSWLDCSNPQNPIKRSIDYNLAGELIQAKIDAILDTMTEESELVPPLQHNNGKETLLTRLKKELAIWKRTNSELEDFISDSFLSSTYMSMCNDYAYFNIAYPEFVLNKGRGLGAKEPWNHRIKSLNYYRAMCCRMEQLDSKGVSNFVYYNKLWSNSLSAKDSLVQGSNDTIAIDSVTACNAISRLKDIVARNRNVVPGARTLRLVMPVVGPSVDKFYYPEPQYLSIFKSSIFEYSQRLIRNKAIDADNDNMWGHIVYIHEDYINKLYSKFKASTPEEQEKVENDLYDEINDFLENDANKGLPFITYNLKGYDDKGPVQAVKIEKVDNSKSTAETKDELEEIASILFFAMEMHPSIAGATPGKNKLAGGTETRELFLLKNVRMAAVRTLLLHPLNIVKKFNEWDSHLEWSMPYPVLTTLDANKQGITDKSE